MSTHTLYPQLPSKWPSTILDLGGDEMPCRVQGSLQDLEVFGTIPEAMEGTFYRVMPDPSQPPIHHKNGEMFIPLDGDGIVSAFKFAQGHVDWKQKYVGTERYKAESAARKSLFGVYRNPFTHHPCVQAVLESTANTNVVIHAGKLLALKENGPAYELDPVTLETKGYNPFGQSSKTFTAHPKLDVLTGNLVGFGYEAAGLATRDVCYFELDSDGKVLVETYFKWPFVGFIHDCILTKNYFILYNWSFECDLEILKQGGHHWTYSDKLPMWFAVIPRHTKDASTIKFHKWHAGMAGHAAGGWEDADGKIQFETTFLRGNGFPFLPERDVSDATERPLAPAAANHYVRWTIDPAADDGSWVEDPQYLIDAPLEFPRVDERLTGTSKAYSRAWMSMHQPLPDVPPRGPPALNALAQYNTSTGEKDIWHCGPHNKVQECVFIPRSTDSEEGDGFVMAMVNRGDLPATELVILDTNSFAGPPVAVVRLPLVLKAGIHGNWVEAARLE